MKSNLKYFGGSFLFALLCVGVATFYGWHLGGVSMAVSFFVSVLALWILEMSVSLDNAVVNAEVLQHMDAFWRKIFLTVGILIAVFGMRLVLPVGIVSAAALISPWQALDIALHDATKYQQILSSVHVEVMAFGSTFLLLVAAKFFFDPEKEVHWVPGLEAWLQKFNKVPANGYVLAVAYVGLMSVWLQAEQGMSFYLAGMAGIATYLLVQGLGRITGGDATVHAARAGLAGFLYLEVLDASFSFDGVIAAFAISNDFIVIACGLGAGAIFVRSITIWLVDKGVLDELKYLANGAYVSILWLVATMALAAVHIEVGEVVVAGVSAIIILLAAWHSKKVAAQPATA